MLLLKPITLAVGHLGQSVFLAGLSMLGVAFFMVMYSIISVNNSVWEIRQRVRGEVPAAGGICCLGWWGATKRRVGQSQPAPGA